MQILHSGNPGSDVAFVIDTSDRDSCLVEHVGARSGRPDKGAFLCATRAIRVARRKRCTMPHGLPSLDWLLAREAIRVTGIRSAQARSGAELGWGEKAEMPPVGAD
jgi:hypothetical protein